MRVQSLAAFLAVTGAMWWADSTLGLHWILDPVRTLAHFVFG
jgi:hypothetical protein